jgi:hypothetical protein
MKIDGVEYKFKKGTSHSTNKRFVGYIAQQIESVVPEAVQLIDGILHVDYESLIPYLSESIKQNFNDIKDIKSEQYRIKAVVDMLYDDFIKRERAEKINVHSESGPKSQNRAGVGPRTARQSAIFALLGITSILLAVAIGLYFIRQKPVNESVTPVSTPKPESPPFNLNTDRQALVDLFLATNGGSWNLSSSIVRKIPWMSDQPVCLWAGVTCVNYRISLLSLSGFKIHGTLPQSIGNLDALVQFDLSHNNLTGTIPASIAQMKNLTYFIMTANSYLSGTLPDFPRAIQTIHLQGCNLTGTIPPAISALPVLSDLRLFSNQLSGTIPPLQGSLQFIYLGRNRFEGTLPAIYKTKVEVLNVAYNSLNGTLENLGGVTFGGLIINDNKFTGEAGFNISATVEYDFQNNQFTSFNSSLQKPIILIRCNATNNPLKCPIPDWAFQSCKATCTY